MKKDRSDRSKGFALVMAMLILLVLTIIGISTVNTSIFETKIAANDRVKTVSFYAAEAGNELALNQLPILTPVHPTQLGEGTSFWTGSYTDKNAPKSLNTIGTFQMMGFDSNWAFKRIQINTTGQSFEAHKEIEAQVAYGPLNVLTSYNN